jgi:hypothetical protein
LLGGGQSKFRQLPQNQQARNYLGGNVLPSVAQLQIPLETKPGEYTLRVTITDRTANKSQTLDRKASVLPADFGLIHLHTSADREGKVPVAPVGTVGQSLYIDFAVVGFQREAGKQPNIEVALRVLDDKGQPTTAKPLTGTADKDIPPDVKIIPLQFGLTLNRLGRFTVELSASDKVSGKVSRVSFPLSVVSLE